MAHSSWLFSCFIFSIITISRNAICIIVCRSHSFSTHVTYFCVWWWWQTNRSNKHGSHAAGLQWESHVFQILLFEREKKNPLKIIFNELCFSNYAYQIYLLYRMRGMGRCESQERILLIILSEINDNNRLLTRILRVSCWMNGYGTWAPINEEPRIWTTLWCSIKCLI